MVLIFGFTIGEITGIAALLSSALIFYFGYSQIRKSEQIKITREIMDRVSTEFHELRDVQSEELHVHINGMLKELEYFRYLLEIHEIRDEGILRYYLPRVEDYLLSIERVLRFRAEVPKELQTKEEVDFKRLMRERIHALKNMVKSWLDKYGLPHIPDPGR